MTLKSREKLEDNLHEFNGNYGSLEQSDAEVDFSKFQWKRKKSVSNKPNKPR